MPRIEHYVSAARKLDDMSEVTLVGIDETSKPSSSPSRDGQMVDFAADLKADGGDPAQIITFNNYLSETSRSEPFSSFSLLTSFPKLSLYISSSESKSYSGIFGSRHFERKN